MAAKLGLTAAWVADRAQAMREWAGANRNRQVARKADWDQAFDGWLRRDALAAKGIKGGGATPLLVGGGEPRFDFGGGFSATEATIVRTIRDGRWPSHGWGPPPGDEGCKLPERLIRAASHAGEAA